MSEKLKLELNVTRSPLNDHNETTFAATLFVDRIDNENGLHLSFVTDPDGEACYFDTDIYPRHFATVAQMMIDAAPEAAIRAFGKAMETAKTFST
ncbi:hypothetical protein ABIE79_010065 [Bradyrhizobium diazoefficiens]